MCKSRELYKRLKSIMRHRIGGGNRREVDFQNTCVYP